MNRAVDPIQALPIYDMRSVLALVMFLLIADSNKWKARELSSTWLFVDCKRQELSSTAFVHCSISKAIFSIINIHLFLGTPTSGHPNLCTLLWAPQLLGTPTSVQVIHYFVTKIEFVRNRPKRADVPIWRKSDLSRKLWICNAFTLTLKFSVNAPHRKTIYIIHLG